MRTRYVVGLGLALAVAGVSMAVGDTHMRAFSNVISGVGGVLSVMVGGSSPRVNIGTQTAMSQSESLTMHSSNAGIHLDNLLGAPWSVFANLSNVLEVNTENADGSNPQTQCQWNPPVGGAASFSCVGAIQAPSFSIPSSSTPQVAFQDTGNATNKKIWRLAVADVSGAFKIQTLPDNQSTSTDAVIFSRGAGDATLPGPITISNQAPLIIASTRTSMWSGGQMDLWGQMDFLSGDGVVDSPDVRVSAQQHVGLAFQFNRIGSTDSDERLVFKDQNGNIKLTWDAVNNRLRIGDATAPTNTLDVSGNALVTGNLTVSGTLSGAKSEHDFCAYSAANLASGTVFSKTAVTYASTVTTDSNIDYGVTGIGAGNFVAKLCGDGATCSGANVYLTCTKACTDIAGTAAACSATTPAVPAGTTVSWSVATSCTTDPAFTACAHFTSP